MSELQPEDHHILSEGTVSFRTQAIIVNDNNCYLFSGLFLVSIVSSILFYVFGLGFIEDAGSFLSVILLILSVVFFIRLAISLSERSVLREHFGELDSFRLLDEKEIYSLSERVKEYPELRHFFWAALGDGFNLRLRDKEYADRVIKNPQFQLVEKKMVREFFKDNPES